MHDPEHLHLALSVCERCNRAGPLRKVRFRHVRGRWAFLWRFGEHGGELCPRCTHVRFGWASFLNTLLAASGFTALLIAPVVHALNLFEWVRALGPGAYQLISRSGSEKSAEEPLPERVELDFKALPPVRDGSAWPAEWWIAMSHIRSTKGDDFISLTSTLSILGVVLGVAIMNCVLAVMTGFEIDLRDKILGANAHVVVLKYGGNIAEDAGVLEQLEAVEGVQAAAPFTYTEMMVRSAWSTSGVILKGMDPARTGLVTQLRDDLELGPEGPLVTPEEKDRIFQAMAGEFPPPAGADPEDGPLPGILIGRELQEMLQVFPGDELQIINPLGTGGGLMGMPTPTVRTFRVAGVFYSGMYEYDTKWTYVSNDEAQRFLKIGDTWTGVEIKVDDIDGVQDISRSIEEKLGYPYYTRHWKNLNQALFEALELEKFVMGLILMAIVLVAGLMIISTMVMLVMTKGREIAILKAMGAASSSILRIFVIEGTFIGLIGTGVGTLLGLVGCWGLDRLEFPLETDVYYLSSLPVVVDPLTVVVISAATFLVCFLVTLYPAWRAASVDPVEGLRYE